MADIGEVYEGVYCQGQAKVGPFPEKAMDAI